MLLREFGRYRERREAEQGLSRRRESVEDRASAIVNRWKSGKRLPAMLRTLRTVLPWTVTIPDFQDLSNVGNLRKACMQAVRLLHADKLSNLNPPTTYLQKQVAHLALIALLEERSNYFTR